MALTLAQRHARAGTFTRAAEELFVTQSAVMQQIKNLQAHFGVPLVHVVGRRPAQRLRVEDLDGEGFVAREAGSGTQAAVDELLRAHGVEPGMQLTFAGSARAGSAQSHCATSICAAAFASCARGRTLSPLAAAFVAVLKAERLGR